jgi:hypothetical protein
MPAHQNNSRLPAAATLDAPEVQPGKDGNENCVAAPDEVETAQKLPGTMTALKAVAVAARAYSVAPSLLNASAVIPVEGSAEVTRTALLAAPLRI